MATVTKKVASESIHSRLRHLFVLGCTDSEIRAALKMKQSMVSIWRKTMPRPLTGEERDFAISFRKARERREGKTPRCAVKELARQCGVEVVA